MAKWVIGGVLLVAACTAPVTPSMLSLDPVVDPAGQRCEPDELFADIPVEAIALNGELWVRGAGGTLAALPLTKSGTAGRITYHLDSERVVDVQRGGSGALWALTLAEEPDDVRIWKRNAGGWAPLLEMGAPADTMALVEIGGWPAILTPERLYVATGDLWTQDLEPPLPAITHYQAVATGTSVWLTARGVGWLHHIDVPTGRTTPVSDPSEDAPCDGLLDQACDVISDLIADPRAPGCVLLTTRGRVLSACAGTARAPRLKLAPAVGQVARARWQEQMRALAMLYPEGSPSRLHLLSLMRAENPMKLARPNQVAELPRLDEDPVLALAATQGGYLALGEHALYRVIGEKGSRIELPDATARCGLEVARAGGAVVVGASLPLPLVAATDYVEPRPVVIAPNPPPCEDTVIFYAEESAPRSVVLSCSGGDVTLLERAQPEDRRYDVPASAWRALWTDLERASWRTWPSCDPTESRASPERFVITTPSHTLQADCPPDKLDHRQRAVLERLRAIIQKSLSPVPALPR